jgi:hypothetical protein
MKSLQDRFYAPIEKAARKIVEYEAANVIKAVNKHLGERSEASFNNWLDDFYTAMPKHIENHLKPVMTAYAEASQKLAAGVIATPVGMTKELTEFADDYISTYTLRHTGSSVGQLKALVASTESKKLAAELKKRVKEWEKTRPAKIARDEVIRESNAVVRASYASAGVKKLKWITQGSKSCDFCNSLSGKIVGIEKNFIEEGTELEGKTGSGQFMTVVGPKAHPPIHQGCVCAIIPIFSAGQIAKGFVKAKTIKEAEEWALKNGVQVLPKTAEEALLIKEKALKQMFKEFQDDPYSLYDTLDNWESKFKSKKYSPFKNLDSDQILAVQNGINHNSQNMMFQELVEDFGFKDHTIFSKPFDMFEAGSGGEFAGATTHIYQNKYADMFLEGHIPAPGKYGTNGWGGISASLRHESGHGIYNNLVRNNPDFRKQWERKVSGIEKIGNKLTKYSSEKYDEAFCELFATITDENYKKGLFSDEIVDLGDFLLSTIKKNKFKPI